MLNFQGTVYQGWDHLLTFPRKGGSVLLVNPGSIFIINQYTPGGAQGSAVIFSLIQTAIENGLGPWRYLTWLIDMAAKGIVDADGLFPWAAPDSCRVSV